MNALIVDIGTSSMRGILFTEQGERLASCQVLYEPVKYPDGRIEQAPRDFSGALRKIASAAAKEAKEQKTAVDAVAVTAQRSAIIPVDRDGKPLMDTIMWQDRRNVGICKELEGKNDLIFERSGARINTVFSGSRMAWILRNCPEVFERIFKLVNIPEFVMHEMTGEYKTDVTYASRSHLMNLRTRRWDEEMLGLFGVPGELLCEILEPGSICGRVTEAFAEETGLPEGIPVITAGGDQQCAAVGQGAYQEGTLSLVAGTGGFLVTALDAVPQNPDPQLIFNCSSVKGRYMVEANVLTCCSAFDWFGRNFYPLKDGGIDYAAINGELKELEGKVSSALVLPYFQGRSTPNWNPGAKAHFGEISLAAGRGDLVKGLLEGIFLEIRNNILLFGDYAGIRKAYISGGLTNSEVINQIQADVYGISLYHMEDSESTAFGALMVALAGLGVYGTLDEAFSVVRGGTGVKCYEPGRELFAEYEKKRERMNEMYGRLYGS